MRLEDGDCDGILTDEDCDDTDEEIGREGIWSFFDESENGVVNYSLLYLVNEDGEADELVSHTYDFDSNGLENYNWMSTFDSEGNILEINQLPYEGADTVLYYQATYDTNGLLSLQEYDHDLDGDFDEWETFDSFGNTLEWVDD